MPENKLFYTDGRNLKEYDFDNYPKGYWNWISGAPEDENVDLYSSVAAVYRVANMSADALASLPFVIMRGENEIDTSNDWQNACGFMRNPKELLRLWRMSLFFTNKAYGFMTGNRFANNIKYIVPTTITRVLTDQLEGVIGFERTVNGEVFKIYVDEGRMFWMFRRDHTTELLASPNTEFKALMNAAGVLNASDVHVKNFYDRGGIKPTLLSVQGVPTKDEREQIENWWDKVMRGLYKFLGKVVVAGTMEVQQIGEGVESLKDSAIHREKIEDVAMAAGMPLSLLLANSANYATARVEYASWFKNSVIPWAEFIEEQMNEKLFEPNGMRFQFRPEITDEGTQEEKERAYAYQALVNSNILPGVAAQMLGFELVPGYEDYEQLTDDYIMMLDKRNELAAKYKAVGGGESVGGGGGDAPASVSSPNQTPPKPAEAQAEEEQMKSAPVELSLDQLRELDLWQQIAFRKLKRGDSLTFPFVCKELNEGTAAVIRSRLPACKSEDDIRQAFDLTAEPEAVRHSDILALATSLNKAVEAVLVASVANEEGIDD